MNHFLPGFAVLVSFIDFRLHLDWQIFKQFFLLHPWYPYLVLKNVQNYSAINSSCLWYSVFIRNNHEGTDWRFLPCSLWISSSWIQMPDAAWSVLSAAGKCSELFLAFAHLKNELVGLFCRTCELKANERMELFPVSVLGSWLWCLLSFANSSALLNFLCVFRWFWLFPHGRGYYHFDISVGSGDKWHLFFSFVLFLPWQ